MDDVRRGPRFGLIVHHTDAEREWAYDRNSHIGSSTAGSTRREARLDRRRHEADWKVIYPFQK